MNKKIRLQNGGHFVSFTVGWRRTRLLDHRRQEDGGCPRAHFVDDLISVRKFIYIYIYNGEYCIIIKLYEVLSPLYDKFIIHIWRESISVE